MVKKISGNKPPKTSKTQTESTSPKMPKPQSKAIASSVSSKKFWAMDFMAERGFKSGKQSPAFVSAVEALGWEKFTQHRNSFIPSIVREFYAGIPESTDGHAPMHSIVRKVRVPFDARTINEWYELGYHGTHFEKKVRTWGKPEMEELKTRITADNAPWEKLGNEFKVKKSYLIEEANMWFNFIRHSLLPTAHTTSVEKERLILIDAIMQGENIDVGRLIAREILQCRGKPMGNLFFPCLITELCINADIEVEKSEERKMPAGPFPTDFKSKQKPTAVASGEAAMLQHQRLQQQAMWRFFKEQFEWQKAMFAQITKGKSSAIEPEFPEWVLEENKTEEAGVEMQPTKPKYPPKKKAPAKRTMQEPESEEELELSSDDSEEEEELRQRMRKEVNSEEESEESENEEPQQKDTLTPPSPPIHTTTSTTPQPQTTPPPTSTPPQTKQPSPPPPQPEAQQTQPPQKEQHQQIQSPKTTTEEIPQPHSPQNQTTTQEAIASEAIASLQATTPEPSLSPTIKIKQTAGRNLMAKLVDIPEEGTAEEAEKLNETEGLAETAEGVAQDSEAIAPAAIALPEQPAEKPAEMESGRDIEMQEKEESSHKHAEEAVAQPGQQSSTEEASRKFIEDTIQALGLAEMVAKLKAEKEKAAAVASSATASTAETEGPKEPKRKKQKTEKKPPQQPQRASSRLKSGVTKK